MANLNLSLDNFIVPGLGNYTPEFGTKLDIGKGLSTAQVNSNIMMPFTAQRPLVVVENSTTTKIESDRRLIINNGGLTLTLGQATFAGCKIQVSAGFRTGTSFVRYQAEAGIETQSLTYGTTITLISDTDGNFALYERIYKGHVMNSTYDTKGGVNVATSRFCIFDFSNKNHKSIIIKADTHIPLDIYANGSKERRWYDIDTDTSYDLESLINTAVEATSIDTGISYGRDFYLYLCADDDSGTKIVISCDAESPNDINPEYSKNNTRKICQFHTLCSDAGDELTAQVPCAPGTVTSNMTYLVKDYESGEDGFYNFYNKRVISVLAQSKYDVLTVEHPLRGFLAGDILPESIWCLTFHPFGKAEGTVYDKNTNIAVSIYLQSGIGKNSASRYAAPTTRSREPINHEDDLRQIRQRLPDDHEFLSYAQGSNERTAIKGAAEASIITTGGHVDTANRRLVSFIGVEDCCGTVWQWLRVYGPTGGSGFATYDGHASFGQSYGIPYQLLAGGSWDAGSSCGSRSRHALSVRSAANANCGARGVSSVIR